MCGGCPGRDSATARAPLRLSGGADSPRPAGGAFATARGLRSTVGAAEGTALRRCSGRCLALVGSDEARPYLRLFGQLHALAGGSPHAEFLRESVLDWLPIVKAGFAADGLDQATALDLATLTLAVVRGLLQDANAIGERERTSTAFLRYVSLLPGAR